MFSVILSYKQSVVFQNKKRSRTVTLYLNQLVTIGFHQFETPKRKI